MYRIVYHLYAYYWAILDEHGNEVDWATTKEWAERKLRELEENSTGRV